MVNLPYTVVGVYPEGLNTVDRADGLTYVEWVEAKNGAVQAAAIAQSMYPERDEAIVVAVFEGHIVDKLYDIGLASTDGADCHLSCENCAMYAREEHDVIPD